MQFFHTEGDVLRVAKLVWPLRSTKAAVTKSLANVYDGSIVYDIRLGLASRSRRKSSMSRR